MSVILALLLAASPAAATTEAPAKKPRLRCEWIHEVGTSRPRRVCEKVPPKTEQAAPSEAPATEKRDGEVSAGSNN
jgi:hypothetical protein